MPEGPEIRNNSLFINHVCNGKIFSGKPIRSMVAKSPEIDFECKNYTISSKSRGKELALTLQSEATPASKVQVLFRFGMSGKFMFTPEDQLPKHAHLQFYTLPNSSPSVMNGRPVLSFVDARRFGSWQITDEWGKDRGPDVVYEHHEFRENVLSNLHESVFNKSICEVLLNQRFFNGIGNYLRAEILHRAKIPPFACARDVLENCSESCTPDILQLCHDVPLEVIQMKQDAGKMFDTALGEQDYRTFSEWLQCYDQQGMKSVKDHNGRTIWYKGVAGPLAPKQTSNTGEPRRKRHKRNRVMSQSVSVKAEESEVVPPPKQSIKSDLSKRHPQVQAVRRSARLMAAANRNPAYYLS